MYNSNGRGNCLSHVAMKVDSLIIASSGDNGNGVEASDIKDIPVKGPVGTLVLAASACQTKRRLSTWSRIVTNF